jgi:hypothetical protein
MLGFQPLASRPYADISQELPNAILADTGRYLLRGHIVILKQSTSTGYYRLIGYSVEMVRSISAAGLNRIFLTASSARLNRGYKLITNFSLTAGDTKTLVVTVRDTDGSAVNIVGATIHWRCAKSFNKTAAVLKSTSDGITISDGANGQMTIQLDADDTEDLVGLYYHEIELTSAAGDVSTVLRGTMKVTPQLIAT